MADLNTPNEYGIPLHACNGYRQDEHYWAWLGHRRCTGTGPFYEWLRSIRARAGLSLIGNNDERKTLPRG